MGKSEVNKVGFEVLEENEENIVYKRVLRRNLSAKEKRQREMSLPKVTFHYFDTDDIQRIQEIQSKLAEKYVQEKEGEFVISLKAIRNFLLR